MSTVILTQQTTSVQRQIFYSSLIGFISGLTAMIMVLIHVSKHYYALFCKQKSNQNKNIYILVLLLCILSVIIISIFCFIRSNFFTGIGPSEFTHDQCVIGYTSYYIFYYSCGATFYMAFIYKIQLTFKNSVYRYKPCTYKTVYGLIIINWLLSLVQVLLRGLKYNSYKVIYTDIEGLTVCSSHGSLGILFTVISYGINILIQGILLYMFSRGLWALNKKMLQMYMEEQVAKQIATPTSVSSENIKTVVDKCKSDIDRDRGNSKDANSISIIVELYNLIKKQAILCCIAVVSTTLMGVVSAFVEETFIFEVGWDALVNIICLWLMLSTSKKYWKCCKDYGLCKCCYLMTGNLR